jgi:UDP-GlcNAc:undecaprenyl-phosphate GlcNAc-1-phosphate transferase
MIYLTVFGIAFLISLTLTPLSIWLGRRWRLTDQPGGRRRHLGEVSRLGGLALFAGFAGTGLLIFVANALWGWPVIGLEDRKLLTGVLLGCIGVFAFGLWDDWHELAAWPQFAAQFGVALIAIAFDIIFQRVTLPLLGQTDFPFWLTYPLTIFWVMGMINTVNWLDGVDGLAAGVAAIAGLLFALHAYRLGQTTVALFPLALAAACLGFLPFNFHPARLFMGSSGSMVLGFALASLSILAPAKIATTLLVLGIPIIDVAWLVIYRWQTRGNPMLAGRDHLHYRLLDLGLSQRQIVLLYYTVCALFGLLALLVVDRLVKLIILGVMGSLTLLLLWALARQAHKPSAS